MKKILLLSVLLLSGCGDDLSGKAINYAVDFCKSRNQTLSWLRENSFYALHITCQEKETNILVNYYVDEDTWEQKKKNEVP